MKIEDFLERKFREYYRENSYRIQPPQKLEKREFGFAHFRDKMMVRHKQFTSPAELRRFVEDTAPSDVYYSTAYYSRPEEEMEHKGWLGADLVFDIDADHIPTTCKELHDRWTCKMCGRSGKGSTPPTCPSCNNERFSEYTWVCETCLREAKNQGLKLMGFLIEDYGFLRKDLKVFFTGHRGYHIHVMSEMILSLDSDERKEIVDYVLGNGLDLDGIGILERGSSKPYLPEDLEETRGWKRRMLRKLVDVLSNGEQDDLINLGFKSSVAKTIVETRRTGTGYQWAQKIVEELDSHAVGGKSWEKILRRIVDDRSARIDTVVTTDVHRLIRANETLNGRTGLRAVEVYIDKFESFDPLQKAIGIRNGEETIEVEDAPEFRLEGLTFGPYKKERVTLPAAAAVLLVCKGKARPVT